MMGSNQASYLHNKPYLLYCHSAPASFYLHLLKRPCGRMEAGINFIQNQATVASNQDILQQTTGRATLLHPSSFLLTPPPLNSPSLISFTLSPQTSSSPLHASSLFTHPLPSSHLLTFPHTSSPLQSSNHVLSLLTGKGIIWTASSLSETHCAYLDAESHTCLL